MRVMRVEAVHENLHPVGVIIVVVIHQQAEVRLLRKINAFRGQLEADGQMQPARKNRLLVRAPVTVGVLEDEQLVVGPLIAGLVMRIRRHHRHPESALRVEGHLHGILHVRKFFFRSEQLDLVALHHGDFLDGFLTVEILDGPFEIRRHRRQRTRLRVVHGETLRGAFGYFVQAGFANRHQLARLRHFLGIILRTVGRVTLAVRVDAVHEVVIVVPEEILFLHRRVEKFGVSFRLNLLIAKHANGQHRAQHLVALLRGRKTVDGEWRLSRPSIVISRGLE